MEGRSTPLSFAALLRNGRLGRGWTQEDLAAASMVSVRAIRDLESGTTANPRTHTVELLADALQLDAAGRGALRQAARSTTSPASGDGEAMRPAQLPRDLADYVGRTDIITSVTDLLRRAPDRPLTPVVIVGMGGIGKTSLAVRIGHQIRADYPDGALVLDLNGAGTRPLSVGDALTRQLRDLRVHESDIPTDVDERSALLRTVTTSRRLLVVLDNARDAAQVRPLIPGNPDCAVIITSRNGLDGLEGTHRIDLEPFSSPDAWSLLANIAGPGRLAAEQRATTEVIDGCAGLPLAIRIVGSRLASRPGHTVQALADRLTRPDADVLSEFTAGDLALRSSFETSIEALDDRDTTDGVPTASAFRLLGLWPGDQFDIRAGAALLGTTPEAAEDAFERLTAVHLLQAPHPGRYRFHDLLKSFARERCHRELAPAERHAALTRLVNWYLRTADRATATFAPYFRLLPLDKVDPVPPESHFADATAALAWCDRERTNLVTIVRAASDAGLHHQAWMLGTILLPYWEQRMLWPEWIETHLLARQSARADGDLVGEGRALTGLAGAYRRCGDTRAAITFATESLAVHRELGDHTRRLSLMDTLAMTYYEAGKPELAVPVLEQILADDYADPFRLSTAANHLGIIRRQAGAYPEAVVLIERGLRIAHDADLPHCVVAGLRSLGHVYLSQGDLASATRTLTECIDRARALDDRIHQAEALRHLALASAASGDRSAGIVQLTEAIDLMVALRHPGETIARQELCEMTADRA